MIRLYKALIRSRIEFCSPLWQPAKIEDIKTLESVQRLFTSKITEVSHLNYYSRLKSLKIQSLQRMRERFIIQYTLSNSRVSNSRNLPNSRSGPVPQTFFAFFSISSRFFNHRFVNHHKYIHFATEHRPACSFTPVFQIVIYFR